MASLDFTMHGTLAASLAASLSLPIYLLLVVRIPSLAGRNALQFLVSVMITIGVWTSALLFIPAARPTSTAEIVMGAMVVCAVTLFYLEIWALLSRGYTLSLISTIYQSGHPLSAAELARSYRRGQGLEWIMDHRVAGLEAAGLVQRDGDRLVLTPRRGRLVAWSYRLAIRFLGLKATG
jgi:hypothetical protein